MIVSTAKHGLAHERVIVLAPAGDDAAAVASGLLTEAGIHADVCAAMDDLCAAIAEGAGAAVIAEECLTPDALEQLAARLAAQPCWSDFPLIILVSGEPGGDGGADGGAEAGWQTLRRLGPAGTAAILERPVSRATLLSAIHVALRARRRQYELRDHLADLQRHERALRESKERYRQLVETSPDAVFAASPEGRIVYANAATLRLFGATDLEGIIGGSFLERIDPEDRPGVLHRLRRATRSSRREDPLECRWSGPGGGIVQIELATSSLPWEGAAAVQVTVRDVSARRLAEHRQEFLVTLSDAIRDMDNPVEIMEAAAAAVVEHLGVARAVFADLDADGGHARRAAAHGVAPALASDLFDLEGLGEGIAGPLMQGRTVVVPDARTDPRTRAASEYYESIRLRAGVCAPVVRHDKSVALFAAYQPQPRAWTESDVALIEEIGRRIWVAVERARTAASLRESEERFRLMADAAPVLIWVAATDKRCTYFNKTWLEFTGRTLEQELNDGWTASVHPDDLDRCVGTYSGAFDRREPFRMEYRMRRADGQVRWVMDSGVPRYGPDSAFAGYIGSCVDITERRETEQALRESEQNFRSVTESLPQMVWTATPDGEIDYCNARWFEYTGHPAGADRGVEWQRTLHPDDAKRTVSAWAAAIRSHGAYQVEHRVRRADGVYRWHLTRAFPVHDAEGRILRWFGTATDIDDHKQLEAALRTSEEEYRAHFQLAAVGKSQADAYTGRLIRVNRKLCEITGYSEEELLGMTFLDLTHPDDRERNASEYQRLLRGELGELSIEKRYIRKDGGEIWVDVNTAIVRDPEGRPLRCIGVVQDNTARRRAEEALRRSEQHIRDVLDGLEVAVGVLTPEGVVLEVNRDTLESTGMTPGDVVGRRLDEMGWFSEDEGEGEGTRAQVRAAIDQAAAGTSARLDVVARADGDRRFVMDLTIAPMFGSDGAVTRLIASAIDITRRVEAESALRESEGRYRELAEALPQLVWTSDAEGRTDYVNRQYRRYTGLAMEHIAGAQWVELLHPDDRAHVAASWSEAVRGGAPYDVEFRLRGADGQYRWFQTRAVSLRNAHGRIVRWFGTCTDIHERREAADALRRSEERLRLVAKATNDAVWDWDLTTDRIEWGDAVYALFGYQPGDVEGNPRWWAERLHPDDRERVTAGLDATIEDRREFWTEDYRFRRADGTYAHIFDRGYAVRDAAGRPVRMIGAMLDVSARKETEEALRASEARFRQLADSMPQIVWSAAPDGSPEYVNRRWLEFASAGNGCFDPERWREFLHPEDGERIIHEWAASVRAGSVFQAEYRLRVRATGEYRWHLGRAVPVRDAQGRILRWFGTATDIHDQKLAQHRLTELVDELNRSNRELEDFAHIASHDLKEPLRGIRNYGSFLMEDYGEMLDAEGKRKLRTIDRLGKRMDDLISSLLYYSQVGRTEMAIEDTDLNQVVLEVLESLGPTLSERSVDIRLPRPLPVVRCDRVRVAEVFRNLITNAIKYNDKPDPWVEISWRPPTLPDREGSWPVLYVEDNGIGIPPQHHATVFGIFKRLHGRDDYGGGTGSGLAFVKRIVERHRGRIWIESTEGEGTTFCFTLGREEHAAAQITDPHR